MVKFNLQLFAKTVTDSIVNDVIKGKYGNGDARKTALANAGYDYSQVQAAVNAKLKGSSSGSNTTNTQAPSNNVASTPTTTNTSNILGVDQSLVDRANSSFSASESVNKLEQGKNDAINKFNEHISTDIIDSSIYDGLSEKWNGGSESVQQANAWIQSQLGWLQNGGKTQWSDKYSAAIDKYLNREEFEYDVDKDVLFQQALASAMNSGKTAMQDTIGQASALTGGYGSTYATSVGNQAYNSFIEDAYNNLPQYYQMALAAYEAEGQELYNQVSMLGQADQNEYNKGLNALNSTMDWRNQIYQEEYSAFRDHKTDLYNIGNLQATEWNSKADAYYNSYNISANEYESAYKKEWNSWQQDVNTALEFIGIYNSDAWNQKNFDEGVRQFNYSIGDTNNDGVVSDAERAAIKSSNGRIVSNESGELNVDDIPKAVSAKVSKLENDGERAEYIDAQVAAGVITEAEGDYLYGVYKDTEQLPITERTWTMTDDGGFNLGWGIDRNGKVKDQYGKEYTLADLYEEAKKTMSNSDAKNWVKNLQKKLGIAKQGGK